MIGFQALASGSKANCMILGDKNNGTLLDVGLGVRSLNSRLDLIGWNPENFRSAVLTHTHGDHWSQSSLMWLSQQGIRLWCHEAHAAQISPLAPGLNELRRKGLLSLYKEDRSFQPMPGWNFHPIPVSHDSDPTFGFRCDHTSWSMAYLADLGTTEGLPWENLANLDFLAIESNHDPDMLRQSNRPKHLINRIAGNSGHLSNHQCAETAVQLMKKSSGRLESVLLLHLSSECNSPELALRSTRSALQGTTKSIRISVAPQGDPSPRFSTTRAA